MGLISQRKWVIIKTGGGCLYTLLVLAGAFLLWRMAMFRAALEYPDSSLFLARALVWLPMAACAVMAVWCFASLWVRPMRREIGRALAGAAAVCGAGVAAFTACAFGNVLHQYAQWAGGSMLWG